MPKISFDLSYRQQIAPISISYLLIKILNVTQRILMSHGKADMVTLSGDAFSQKSCHDSSMIHN